MKNFCPKPPPTSWRLDPHEMRRHAGDPRDRLLGLVRVLRAHPRVQLARGRLVRRRRSRASPSAPGVWRCWRNVRRTTLSPCEQRLELGRDRERHLRAEVRPELGMHDRHAVVERALDVDDRGLARRSRPRRARPRPRRRSGSRRRSSTIGSPTKRTSPSASGRSGAPGIVEQQRRLHRARVRIEIGRGQHRDHAVERARRLDVDAHDAPARDVAAHERAVQHARAASTSST